MTSMQDKLVLVTGAGRGLGAAIAAGFAREGARLIVADLDAALATASAQAIRDAGGRAVEATLDVTDADAVRVSPPIARRATAISTCWSTTPASPPARPSTIRKRLRSGTVSWA